MALLMKGFEKYRDLMYNKERIERILEILKESGSVSVNELSDIFHVSGATIRSDLAKMDSAGMVTRTHGGAILNSQIIRETLLNERVNNDKKQLIAKEALRFIHERDIILLDTGTTMSALAQALVQSDIEELTVFSNDLDVIRILEEKEHFSLTLFAGKVRNGFHYCYGAEMLSELANYHFTTLFLAASAIHRDHGLTTENSDLARIKSAMVSAADRVILLADSSKVGGVHLRKFASLSDIDLLIMDHEIDPENEKMLQNKIRNLIFV